MSVEKRPVGKIVVRTFEAVLAAWFIKADLGLFYAGKHDAAVRNVILTVSVVVIIEALMWLVVRPICSAHDSGNLSSVLGA